MTIRVDRANLLEWTYDEAGNALQPPVVQGPNLEAGMLIDVPARHVAEFKELVFRATNLWPDSSAAIKVFADVVIHGRVLQNYEETYKPLRAAHRS